VIDAEGRLFSSELEIHILELPKFLADQIRGDSPGTVVILSREATNIDPEHCPPCLTLPTIHKAIEELNMISLNEADHQLYLSRRKYSLDEQSRRYDAISEGIEIGLIASRIQSLESLLGRGRHH